MPCGPEGDPVPIVRWLSLRSSAMSAIGSAGQTATEDAEPIEGDARADLGGLLIALASHSTTSAPTWRPRFVHLPRLRIGWRAVDRATTPSPAFRYPIKGDWRRGARANWLSVLAVLQGG